MGIRLVLVLISLTIAPARAGDQFTVEAPWDCPQSQAGLPAKSTIRIPVDYATGDPDLSEFKAMVEKANKQSPQIDYYSCFLSVANYAWNNTWGSMSFVAKVKTKLGKLQFQSQKVYSALFDAAGAYGAAASSRGAVSAFKPGGTAVPPLTDDEVESLAKTSLNSCGETWDARCFDPAVISKIGATTQDPDQSQCKNRIAKEYARQLLDSEMDAKECGKFPDPCEARRRAVSKALSLLNNCGLTPFTNSYELREFCKIDWKNLNTQMRDYADKIKATTGCLAVTPGDSRVVGGDTGSGLQTDYTLTGLPSRKNEQGVEVPAYQATLNLRFTDGKGNENEAFQRSYTDKAKQCYADAAPYLRGPKGQFLEIKLTEDAPGVPQPKPNKISVDAATARADSHSWEVKIDCDTIIHESLHLLGLVDEYQEKWMGPKMAEDGTVTQVAMGASHPKYDCRTEGPEDSVMADQHKAFEAVKGGPDDQDEVGACSCSSAANPAACAAKIDAYAAKPTEAGCPGKVIRFKKKKGEVKPPQTFNTGEDSIVVFSAKRKEPTRKSLFLPAQWRALVSPGCEYTNPTYYRCAREAYRTSRGHLGSDKCGQGLPAACATGGSKWLQ